MSYVEPLLSPAFVWNPSVTCRVLGAEQPLQTPCGFCFWRSQSVQGTEAPQETVTRGSVLGEGLREGFGAGVGVGGQRAGLPGLPIRAADGMGSSHPPPHFSPSPAHPWSHKTACVTLAWLRGPGQPPDVPPTPSVPSRVIYTPEVGLVASAVSFGNAAKSLSQRRRALIAIPPARPHFLGRPVEAGIRLPSLCDNGIKALCLSLKSSSGASGPAPAQVTDDALLSSQVGGRAERCTGGRGVGRGCRSPGPLKSHSAITTFVRGQTGRAV